MRIANYQGVFDLTALVSIRVNIKHAHKQSFQSNVKNRTRPLKWMLFCFCLFFDDFFESEEKEIRYGNVRRFVVFYSYPTH